MSFLFVGDFVCQITQFLKSYNRRDALSKGETDPS